ncbi:TauD/TfdA family dioxygenase [Streptomyces sp. NPDC093509]|uniref:TauD/TfdA family dioxygenase n=1 Tax=Streptomyces sp. NPDC093509 TaxID=3154982 RepID=UPI00344EC168
MYRALSKTVTELPDGLRGVLKPGFSAEGLFVLKGLPVEQTDLGPTPAHWSTAGADGAVWDVVLMLMACAMGRLIAWQGQQEGRMVNNIVPSPGHEQEQTGASSTVLLSPHTEDAFHPGRAHLLLLACMRNPDRVATTAASVRRARLSHEDVAQLSRPVLPILPDDAYTQLPGATDDPQPVRTLWQSPEGLGLRFDPAYTPLEEADRGYRLAYGRLEAELSRVSRSVVLEPGDVLVADNDTVVHGRVPFRPRYDGSDRWLKRALVRVSARQSRPESEREEHGYGQSVIEL